MSLMSGKQRRIVLAQHVQHRCRSHGPLLCPWSGTSRLPAPAGRALSSSTRHGERAGESHGSLCMRIIDEEEQGFWNIVRKHSCPRSDHHSHRHVRPIWQRHSPRPLRAAGRARATAERAAGACVIRSDGDAQRSLRRLRPRFPAVYTAPPFRCSVAHPAKLGATARTATARRLTHVRRPRGGLAGISQRRHLEAQHSTALLAERLHTHTSSRSCAPVVRLRRPPAFLIELHCMPLRP